MSALALEQKISNRVGVRLAPTNPFNDVADSNPAATFTVEIIACCVGCSVSVQLERSTALRPSLYSSMKG